jgi:hypothetical protein
MRGFQIMNSRFLIKVASSIFMSISLFGYAAVSSAHSASATLDPSNTIRNFTGMAFVNCFDDGNGPADNLIARIRDNSQPVPGLLVNLQIFKGNKSNSITDTVSGDANFSPFITLRGGTGVYWIMVNKTDVGARLFDVEWHCNTSTGVHTGTDIGVTQFGEPAP